MTVFCEYDNKHRLYVTQRNESRIKLYAFFLNKKSIRHNCIYQQVP